MKLSTSTIVRQSLFAPKGFIFSSEKLTSANVFGDAASNVQIILGGHILRWEEPWNICGDFPADVLKEVFGCLLVEEVKP